MEEDIDLDEEIVIPNWDISNLNLDQMQKFGELLQMKDKKKRLREERYKEFQIIEDVKNILAKEINIEVETSQPILNQLAEAVQKFDEDMNGQDKLLQRTKNKLENKVLEYISY